MTLSFAGIVSRNLLASFRHDESCLYSLPGRGLSRGILFDLIGNR
jgi:hypothetical protein